MAQLKHIYTRLPSDLNYRKYIDTSDEVEEILAQIRMILGTRPYEVLGNPYFGVDIKQYLFSLNYNQDEMKNSIMMGLYAAMNYNASKYDISIDVNFGKNHEDSTDYALIDIYINQKKCAGVIVNQQ